MRVTGAPNARVSGYRVFCDANKGGLVQYRLLLVQSRLICASRFPLSCRAHADTTKSTVSTTGPESTTNNAGNFKVFVSRCFDAVNDPASFTIATVCQTWCASHKQTWSLKCMWSETCGGCPECSGEWLSCFVRASNVKAHHRNFLDLRR